MRIFGVTNSMKDLGKRLTAMKNLKGIHTTVIDIDNFLYQVSYDADNQRMYITNLKWDEVSKGCDFWEKVILKLENEK